MANIRTTKKKVRSTPTGREYITENQHFYFDEDSDIIEYLEGKPSTWIIKEAIRFYRDRGKLQIAAAPPIAPPPPVVKVKYDGFKLDV